MTEYVIRYAIEGEARIEAESPEEAQEMFDAMEIEELALSGDLLSDEPKTEDQIKAEIAEIMREGMPVN